ncbi:hypothetical protein KKH65_02450, partial [bacterium]|nr:hypothetical protein [bacterium]
KSGFQKICIRVQGVEGLRGQGKVRIIKHLNPGTLDPFYYIFFRQPVFVGYINNGRDKRKRGCH